MYKNGKILFKVQKKKKLKTKIQEFQIQVTVEQWYYQNVQYATLSKGLLSNLGVRTPLRKVPKLGHILFSSAC